MGLLRGVIDAVFGVKKRDPLDEQIEAFREMKEELKQKSKNELIAIAINAITTVAKYEKQFGKKF